MTMLASIADVETVLGGQVANDDEGSYAVDLIVAASAAVEGYIGKIVRVAGVVRTWRANGPTSTIYVPGPVTAVTSVTVNGSPVQFTWATSGEVSIAMIALFGDEISATFDHGYDPIPDDIRWTVAAMAAHELVAARTRASSGVQSETIGTYSVTYGSAPVPERMLTASHRKALRRYRRVPSMFNTGWSV